MQYSQKYFFVILHYIQSSAAAGFGAISLIVESEHSCAICIHLHSLHHFARSVQIGSVCCTFLRSRAYLCAEAHTARLYVGKARGWIKGVGRPASSETYP